MKSNYEILKWLCQWAKYSGLGDYWYENPKEPILYKIYQLVLFILFYQLTLTTSLEALFYKLPRDLHADSLTLSLAYVILVIRFHSYIYKKNEIRELNLQILRYADDVTNDAEIAKQQYKRIKLSIVVIFTVVYTGVIFYLVEGLRRYFDNQPFVILAAYWPAYENDTPSGIAHKVLNYLTCAYMMASMIFTDMLTVCHLIILYFRFIFLRKYFERLERDFRSADITTLELYKKCLDGICKHRELIWFSKKIMSSFGVMMSLQVLQACALVVLLLLRVVMAAHLTLPAALMNFCFGAALLIQLAAFLWNAGEITYQASMISTAIFHCGWHLRGLSEEGGRDIRRLVLMGCAQAQRPVIMKAFGIQELSYQGYVSVVRASYSLFAVFY